MILLETLKLDWSVRLSYHLRHNRYRGLSRTCFQLLVILYYSVKAVLLLELLFFYFFSKAVWSAIKWCFKLDEREWYLRLKSSHNTYSSEENIFDDFDDLED